MRGTMLEQSELVKAWWEQGKSDLCPVYDMHGHMGLFHSIYFPRGDAEAMIHTMDAAGVRLLVFSHHAALFSPDIGNRLSIEAVRRHPGRLRAYCVMNPNYPELMAQDLRAFEVLCPDVFVGFKFLSDYHQVSLTDIRYRPVWEYAEARGLLVLAHTWGGSTYDGEAVIQEVADRYPHVKFLLGHACHGHWDAAVALARNFPNIYLELTAVFDDRGVLEKFVNEVGSDRLLFGTDLPWFDPHHALGVLANASITDEDRHNICHRNAERLLMPLAPEIVG